MNTPAHSPEAADTECVVKAEVDVVVAACQLAATGDLEARVLGISETSPLAPASHAINAMLDMADAFVRETAAAMENCANDRFHRPILLRGLKGAYRLSAQTINRAGAKMQGSHAQLLFVGGQVSRNAGDVQTVAAACEELNATSREISLSAAETAEKTREVSKQSLQAAEDAAHLADAARNIERVLALINRVSAQTNLLALNAMIEAGRAGEAGRGFAVVANEVKELSRSTRSATEDIVRQMDDIRRTVETVNERVRSISIAVGAIEEGASVIAKSVSEQVDATGSISRSIANVSSSSKEVSERLKAAL